MPSVPPPTWPPTPDGSTPPPGWEPDPSRPPAPAVLRAWHEGPAPVQTPSGPTGPVDNRVVWALALSPVVFLVVDILLLLMGVSPYGGLVQSVSASLVVGLVILDSDRLAAVGVRVSRWWCFVAPVYLVLRTRRARQSWLIPIVWLVAIVGYVFSGPVSAAAGGLDLDSSYLERDIQVWFQENGVDAEVECPDPAIARVHESLTCAVQILGGETVDVVVTVENLDGWYTLRASR